MVMPWTSDGAAQRCHVAAMKIGVPTNQHERKTTAHINKVTNAIRRMTYNEHCHVKPIIRQIQ